ncbi:MAG: glycosyltransferase family 1 protein [Anaerolineales bacterium]
MILADFRWVGPHGIGRLASEILSHFPDLVPLDDTLSPVNPLDALWSSLQIMRHRPRPKLYFTPGYTPPLWSNVPFIFTVCDLNHLDISQNSSIWKRLYYQIVMRPACHRAAFVLTISEFSRNRILDWTGLSPDRVVNISEGVDQRFQPDGPWHDPGYQYFLYIGNHKPHKNIPRLIEAFARSNLHPEIKLILSGQAEPQLERMIHFWRVENSVIFAGIIDEKNLPALYRGALGFVFPSLYEGFGLPPLEAMACGVPVITSNTTSLPEVVGDSALLVNPLDVDELALALQHLASDENLRCALREKGLERAKLFSWERTISITRKTILSVLGEKK